MTFNHALVDEILDAIFPLPEEFGVTVYDEYPSELDNYEKLKNLVREVDKTAEIYFGMSKLVIASVKLNNVVIKIPFNGYFSYSEEDEECDTWVWRPFFWANASDSSDYCLAEYEKFLTLKKKNLDCFVAKTFLYTICNGVRVFIQERVIPLEDCWNGPVASRQSQDLANKWRKEGKIFHVDSEWIANCLDKYKEFKVKKFLTYCNNVDIDILEDMHCGNYGYRSNGTPCLLDYSNFME